MESSYEILAPSALFFRPVEAQDLSRVNELEQAGFPKDEAASPATMAYRQQEAGQYFLVALRGEALIGYVCGTLTRGNSLDHHTMFHHDPLGETLCIHSVCVAQSERHQGVAATILKVYEMLMRGSEPQVKRIRLLCKEALISLYSNANYQVLGPSSVVHGKDGWIECELVL